MPSAVPPGGAASPLSPPRTVEITEHQLAEWKETAGAAAQRELVLRQQLAARDAELLALRGDAQCTRTPDPVQGWGTPVPLDAAASDAPSDAQTRERTPHSPTQALSFDTVDLNHDGVIDRAEFEAAASSGTVGTFNDTVSSTEEAKSSPGSASFHVALCTFTIETHYDP